MSKRFKIGRIAKMTRTGIAAGLIGRAKSPYGRVIAVRPPLQVQILRDGLKHPDWYHIAKKGQSNG